MEKKEKGPPKFPEIGARLALFIEQSGEVSDRQFALRAKLKPQIISHLAAGYSMPSSETLIALATAYKGFDANWLLTGKGASPVAKLTATIGKTEGQDTIETALPTTVKRKMRRPIMTADPDLSHLTPEQQAQYWKRRHDELLADQAQEYEAQVHQETLRLINFPNASSDTADLYAFADSLAIDYPYVSQEALAEVRSLPRFRPATRVIRMRVEGFQQKAS